MNAPIRYPRQAVTWRTATRVLAAIYLGLNIGLSLYSVSKGVPFNPDWALWNALPAALESGSPYRAEASVPFVWSPLMAWVMATVVLHVGFWPWAALHIGALALLRDPLIILLVLASWGFWLDLGGGNTLVFAFVAAFLAVRGSRVAVVVSLVLFLLMPRPVQLPVVIWLLWTMPWSRLPFVALAAAHAALVLVTGLGGEWVQAMLAYGPGSHPYDLGPGRWLGPLWLVIGVPLAGWLWLRGLPGSAGLAISPYVVPQYMLMPLIDVRLRSRAADPDS